MSTCGAATRRMPAWRRPSARSCPGRWPRTPGWPAAARTGPGWGSASTAAFGTVMNWTFWLDRLRKLSPICTRSETVMPASVVIEAAASVTTDSSLIGLDSRPLSSTPLTTWADMNWSRWIRSRSEPVPMSSRVRQKASAWMPLMCCSPAARSRPDTWSFTVERHADVDAAQVVDDLDEAEHADPDEVVDADAGLLLDRLPQAGRAADLQQRVDLHVRVRVWPAGPRNRGRLSHWYPGTMVSRGMLIAVTPCRPGDRWTTMIVSVLSVWSWPVCRMYCSCGVRPFRLSSP